MLGVEKSFRRVRQNGRDDKKDGGGMDWRGLVMRNGAFICRAVILNTADKQLSDFSQGSAAHARLYEMN